MRKIFSERALMIIIGVLAVLSCATVFAIIYSLTSGVNSAQQQAVAAKEQADSRADQELRHILLSDCQRENILRKSDNNAHYGDFVVFSFVDKRFLVPTPTETPAQKKITNEFASALQHAVKDSSWTPPTDCQRAVGTQGSQYSSPTPVKFTTHLPPASALPQR